MSCLGIIPKKNFGVLKSILSHLSLNGEHGNVVVFFTKEKLIFIQKSDHATLLDNTVHLERIFFSSYKAEEEVTIEFLKFKEISKFFSSLHKSVSLFLFSSWTHLGRRTRINLQPSGNPGAE
jgi:hypothetical protein